MNVWELITALETMPKDAIVVQSWYETWYNDINYPKLSTLFIYEEREWRDGKYNEDGAEGAEGIQVVTLCDAE